MANTINRAELAPVITGTPQRKVTNGNNQMGKDQFLHILITQLKNQDPLSPLQDKDFIAQMAQFTSVEQLTQMNTYMKSTMDEMKLLRQSIGTASSLIDKNISWLIPGVGDLPGTTGKGKVEAITIRGNNQFAIVNGEEVSLDRVIRIEN